MYLYVILRFSSKHHVSLTMLLMEPQRQVRCCSILWRIIDNPQHHYARLSKSNSSHHVLLEWTIYRYFLKLNVIPSQEGQCPSPSVFPVPSRCHVHLPTDRARRYLFSIFISTSLTISSLSSLIRLLNSSSLPFTTSPS